MLIRISIITLTLTINVLTQNYGSMYFTNYADDRKGAFSLTFDDGLLTHSTNVRPILNQYGFKGTFYVLPPYLAENNQPPIWRYGRWNDFQLMAAEGHEIGSHTMRHFDLTSLSWGNINDDSTLLYELYQSKYHIEQKIPEEKCISLNYPFTLHNSIVDSAARLFYQNGRTLGQVANDSILTNNDWYSLKAKVVEFGLPRNSVNDDLDELYTFLNWTQTAINNKQWGMLIVHDVVPFNSLDSLLGQIYQPITNEWLSWLCDWLWVKHQNKEIWVETVGNINRYVKQRESAEYQVIQSSEQLIEIALTDNLNNEIYDYPLSVYIKVPNAWEYVRIVQNEFVDTLSTIVKDTGRVVLAKVIPDYALISLTPVGPTSLYDKYIQDFNFNLNQNYPNPFNPSTTISWESPVSGMQTIKIFDVLGQEVETIINEYLTAGTHSKSYTINSSLQSGIYYYQLRVGEYTETKKMVLLK